MKKQLILYPLCLLLSSCSVMMASNRGGTDLDSVQSFPTRLELLAAGAEPIESRTLEDGSSVETFRILKKHGSVARAFMHGLLDLSTGFLWEIAGTPIESTLNEKKFYAIRVTFDADSRVKKMELL